MRRAVGGSENLKGQVVIQGLLKMKILLLIRSNSEGGGGGGGSSAPCPPVPDGPAPELLLDPHGQSCKRGENKVSEQRCFFTK